MRIVIEIEGGHTTVTVDDETVPYGCPEADAGSTIGFDPSSPPEDGESYIGG